MILRSILVVFLGLGIWAFLTFGLLPYQSASGKASGNSGEAIGDPGSQVEASAANGQNAGGLPTVREDPEGQSITLGFYAINPAKPPIFLQFDRPGRDEKPMPFATLLAFLSRSNCHQRRYVIDDYDCKNFSHSLYKEARAAGFAVRMVCISIVGEKVGHAFTGFLTTDRGVVHVDFTPATDSTSNEQMAQKNLVYVGSGETYLRVPVAVVDPAFGNTREDFVARAAERDRMLENVGLFESRLKDLRAGQRGLEERRPKIESLPPSPGRWKIVSEFNNQVLVVNQECDRLVNLAGNLRRAFAEGTARGWNYAKEDWVTQNVVVLPGPYPARAALPPPGSETANPSVGGSPGATRQDRPAPKRGPAMPPGMSQRFNGNGPG